MNTILIILFIVCVVVPLWAILLEPKSICMLCSVGAAWLLFIGICEGDPVRLIMAAALAGVVMWLDERYNILDSKPLN